MFLTAVIAYILFHCTTDIMGNWIQSGQSIDLPIISGRVGRGVAVEP